MERPQGSFSHFHRPWWGMRGTVQAGMQRYQDEDDVIPPSCGPGGERFVLLGFEGDNWSPPFLKDPTAGVERASDDLLPGLGFVHLKGDCLANHTSAQPAQVPRGIGERGALEVTCSPKGVGVV